MDNRSAPMVANVPLTETRRNYVPRGGFFIALEGIDGAGTSTQTRALAQRLIDDLGERVHMTCEPSRGPIGRMIREQLSAGAGALNAETLALLFAADRLDHYKREILPALEGGRVVISDRYVLSSLVYQSLECPAEWVETINARAPWPDLCVLVDLPWEEALARVARRRATSGEEKERYDEPDLQRRLAEGYGRARDAQRPGPIVTIDGGLTIDEVTERLFEAVRARLKGGLVRPSGLAATPLPSRCRPSPSDTAST